MSQNPKVILSAFADEGAVSKTAIEQMATLSALGLEYYSPRFVDVSGEVKNVMALTKQEIKKLNKLHADYGMHVTSIGSPIGKVKLLDVDDGSHNKFVPFKKYLATDVKTAIDRANQLDTKLIRGFSFYHPAGTDPAEHVDQAVDQLAQIVEACAAGGVIFGLEVEANLIGQNGRLLAELSRKVNSPHMVCIFDGGNLACQNLTPVECFDEYEAMRKHIGWMHIKDYAVDPSLSWTGVVDEERLKNFVPANVGDTGHEAILRDFRAHVTKLDKKMKKLGVPGVFLELEPHLKGGGQFGGFSGPDGLGVACRGLCSVLDYVGIDYELRGFEHIRTARGF
ncbi:Xylose isomerase-like TIM barrel [Symmachiella dynata]|uniref:sugar phosphate isomerase/epimerase family protein n=1 Tax=Symmachiella dynata TaxID=2527995 RepID=UPI0011890F72|nr:TIM barrel protein [Symmachiella dynata]QDT50938.1 Xylose isomerase-like TIM barrel [Symmachiella dynata]